MAGEAQVPARSSALPKISVGVLTYNRRDAVRKAIQSVYDQALPDVEVVVVDSANNSVDRRCCACRRYANRTTTTTTTTIDD